MSRNLRVCALVGVTAKIINHRDTEAQRKTKRVFRFPLCLCDSVVNLIFGKDIYREAPSEIRAGLCPAGRTNAAVPKCFDLNSGSGTETCSCTACRSLLSSG